MIIVQLRYGASINNPAKRMAWSQLRSFDDKKIYENKPQSFHPNGMVQSNLVRLALLHPPGTLEPDIEGWHSHQHSQRRPLERDNNLERRRCSNGRR